MAFSPDGKTILTGSVDKTARLWDALTGRSIGRAMEHQGAVQAVAFSQDGQTVLTESMDGTARLWDAATGQPVGPSLQHAAYFLSVAGAPTEACSVQPRRQTIFTANADGTARLWETPAPLPDDLPRLAAWVETMTGMELDEHGAIHALGPATWRCRRDRLDQLGGPPPAIGRTLDPILFGPDPTARAARGSNGSGGPKPRRRSPRLSAPVR